MYTCIRGLFLSLFAYFLMKDLNNKIGHILDKIVFMLDKSEKKNVFCPNIDFALTKNKQWSISNVPDEINNNETLKNLA